MNTRFASTAPLLAYLILPLGVAGQEAPRLTDPQIAHVAVTANAIDVEAAKLARSGSSAQDILSFASTMITDHTAVNAQAGALAARLGVTPEDNPVSRSLQAAAAAVHEKLAKLGGSEFDAAYIEREVGYHQAVLDALDGLLIPQSENPELRSLLEQVRPAIAAHLERARSIAARLADER